MNKTPTVGQEVWVVLCMGWGRRSAAARLMKVSSVGRKWVGLDGGRYRYQIGSRRLDGEGRGYGSPGSVWESREEWAAQEAFDYAWKKLKDIVQHHKTDGLTIGDIRDAARNLRIDLPEWQDPEQPD